MELPVAERLKEFSRAVVDTKVTDKTGTELPLQEGINKSLDMINSIRETQSNLYVIGNGGSAAIASHAVIDFMNVGKISAHTLHDSATLTCMANDYGYENAFSNIVKYTLKPKDILIAISSSGQSENIIAAVETSKSNDSTVITLSGFKPDNKLRTTGDINFWSNSADYGIVEIAHQFILHNIADRLVELQDSK
ncbi:MAG: phosphoheptose isomerase [Parcubacteria group bacterium]|jgi:D-sedoheptulose 7-phosphate isomerase|nr:phosphoheptose isomerase [Parcubacteria group bacterium]|tara:strand:- start:5783 stop:6364 length:582 start_codon:yes stop_codon:yes gene_type:complete